MRRVNFLIVNFTADAHQALQKLMGSGEIMANSEETVLEAITSMNSQVGQYKAELEELSKHKRNVLTFYLSHCNIKLQSDKVLKLMRANEALLNTQTRCPFSQEDAEKMNDDLMRLKKSMEATYRAAAGLFEEAEPLMSGEHYDKAGVRHMVDTVGSAWLRLRNTLECRIKLCTAGVDYYGTVQQVCAALEGLEKDYSIQGTDWCSVNSDDVLCTLDEHISRHNKRKQDFMKACTLVRKAADIFIKYIFRQDGHEDTSAVKDKLARVMNLEKSVLVLWANRRDDYLHCQNYVRLQRSGKEVLNQIKNVTENVPALNSPQYKDDYHRVKMLERTFQELSLTAVECEGSLHGNSIKSWCSAVNKRFHEFCTSMGKTVSIEDIVATIPTSSGDQANRDVRNIVRELILTEQTYVKDLENCIKFYLTPLRSPQLKVPTYVQQNVGLIFGNIEDIYNFHKGIFLPDLETCEEMSDDVGHCFITWCETFAIYVTYCVNKHEADSLVPGSCWDFFKKMQAECSLEESLDSFIVKPVQRITKYHLLLAKLVDKGPPCSGKLREALEQMSNVPEKANNAIHVHHLSGLPENKAFYGDILHQQKLTVKRRASSKLSRDKERIVVLFESYLVIGKILPSKASISYSYLFQLPLSEMIVREVDLLEDQFQIYTCGEEIVFRTHSAEEKEFWVRQLCMASQKLSPRFAYETRRSFLPDVQIDNIL